MNENDTLEKLDGSETNSKGGRRMHIVLHDPRFYVYHLVPVNELGRIGTAEGNQVS
jgi:hypothetical protein